MWDFDYASIGSITRLLEENGLSMTKKFGQNFLISIPSLEKITSLCHLDSTMKVWEVGPGIGALTSHLIRTGAKVTSFEIDHGFCKVLREKAFADEKNFTLVEGDALKNWKQVWQEEGTPDVICANLPYNVGSVFIANLIENRCLPKTMVYTLQSEVVRRICASQNDEEYSGFSILTSMDYENREALKLKSGCFYPAPNVDSSVVLMQRRDQSTVPEDMAKPFLSLVKVLFSQRRKTVRNNLKTLGLESSLLDKALQQANIEATLRAEKLECAQILALARAIEAARNPKN